ncbi:hypothetical protein [Acetobacter fallax]|uniref:Uncharacterized protein n=1 Tax=Acetobacter fallax TaxID=1737473 RepID=A0ABX0KF34_9PROT|nr:hypothetical protein [Acetobacter fallax]NHO33553.1 hypothetical protein [Acetobacter fallax]NHO36522.1 hypothetical protein [Acetobacter fallax]
MKYAVIFKVWRWDSAVENNFRLCRNFSAGADFFILYDRTNGMDDIPENIRSEERIFFVSSEDATDLGLSGSHEGGVNLFWYNADYQHSLFCLKYPDYDFMCFVESDVAVFTPLHAILKKMSKQCIDVIFQPQTQPAALWSHADSCAGYYNPETYINKGLFCISFFSRRAVLHIFRRRLNMTVQQRRENLSSWPVSEAAMAHEPIMAGMRTASLGTFCPALSHYDWSPPYAVSELGGMQGDNIVHPVTEINKNFMEKNFRQDYHSLWSGEEVETGLSRQRASEIRDFEVWSRLFNSPHVRHPGTQATLILQDVLSLAGHPVTGILHGQNSLAHDRIQARHTTQAGFPKNFFSDLPGWDDNHAYEMGMADVVTLTGPFAEGARVLIGARDNSILQKLHIDVKGRSCGLSHPVPVYVFRGMIFYGFDVPASCETIRIIALHHLRLFSLRVSDGSWPDEITSTNTARQSVARQSARIRAV